MRKKEDRKIILSVEQNFHMRKKYFDIKIGKSKKMKILSSEKNKIST